MERIFKRKIYDQLLQWKQSWEGKTAILIEGARRVGKSTIVEQFADEVYKKDHADEYNDYRDTFDHLSDEELIQAWSDKYKTFSIPKMF